MAPWLGFRPEPIASNRFGSEIAPRAISARNLGYQTRRTDMTKEKAKGLVQKVDKREKRDGSGSFWIATIGGVEFMFFEPKIQEFLDQEIEIEYYVSSGGKFIGNFPGSAKPSSGGGFRKGSPEDLKFRKIDAKIRVKTMCLAYGKDLALAYIQKEDVPPEKAWTIIEFFSNNMLRTVERNIKELEDIK